MGRLITDPYSPPLASLSLAFVSFTHLWLAHSLSSPDLLSLVGLTCVCDLIFVGQTAHLMSSTALASAPVCSSSIQWFIYHREDTCHTCQTPREVHSLVIGFVAHPSVTPQTESFTVERWALTSAHGTFHHITVDHLTPRTVIRPFRHRARQDSTSVAIATVRVMFFIVVLGTRFLGRSFSRVFFRSPLVYTHTSRSLRFLLWIKFTRLFYCLFAVLPALRLHL